MRHWVCKFKVSDWHKKILKTGYTFRFANKRPISPCNNNDSIKGCPNVAALINSVNDLKAKRVIQECECSAREFCNRLFLVPKPSGDWRPILNVKRLNRYLIKEKFKMERVQDVLLLAEPDDFMISIDLTDAYLAVPRAESMYRFCTFRIGTQHYRFTRVCFGLTSAPYLFTKFLKVKVLKNFNRLKIKILLNIFIYYSLLCH